MSFFQHRFFDAAPDTMGGAPLEENSRIRILDTVRGIAVLGILLMNIPYFSMPYQTENLTVRDEFSGANYYTWWVINFGFEGTMRGLFTLLFGAGAILLLSRLENRKSAISAADFYYRRLIWLLLFGLFNAFVLLWPGDILYHYAICGLFLFPFRKLKAKHLFTFAMALMCITIFKGTLRLNDARDLRVNGEKALALEAKKEKLTPKQEEAKAKFEGFLKRRDTASMRKAAAEEAAKMKQGNYFAVWSHLKTINQKIESTKFYHSMFWDIMTFLFLGMALFKWKVITGERSKKFYLLLLLGGYAIGFTINYFLLRTMINVRFDFTRAADILYIDWYQIKRVAITLGHIGLIMTLYKFNVVNWLLNLMSKVGQMAFTNYLSQSLICSLIFYGYGFNLFNTLERYEIYYVVGAVWLFQIIFSNIWMRYFQFGPLEWAWRSLTYWKRQPMKRVLIPAIKKTSPETLVVENVIDKIRPADESLKDQ